jgi:glycosyltransferase involved in cell wall biosynthesis
MGGELRCVIVGDAPYADEYIRSLRASADPRVVFTGYVFGEGCRELLSNACAFVETSEVGGTHPALLEAMAAGIPVIVNDTPENLETMGAAGLSYPGDKGAAGLRPVLERLLQDGETARDLGARALERVRAHYSWDRVTDAYEEMFRSLRGAGA